MEGIRIESEARFAEIVSGLSAEIEHLFWLLDLPSGPFDYLARPGWREIDRELEAYYIHVGNGVDTSVSLWRPGIFPKFAPLLIHDEWSYFVGLEGPEDAARAKAEALSLPGGYLSPEFFEAFQECGQLFALLAHDWWEVYSPNGEWLSRLSREWQSAPVASSKWAAYREGDA